MFNEDKNNENSMTILTVQALIDKLKMYSPDTLVHIQHMDDGGYYSGDSPVTDIIHDYDNNKIILE